MQNYDIRYDDKYGQLAQIDVAAEGAGYEPWVNQTLTSVKTSARRTGRNLIGDPLLGRAADRFTLHLKQRETDARA